MSELLESAWALLDRADSILITSHVNPDGDAVGSLLALGLIMEARGKRVTMALQDPVPGSCLFLPGASRVVHPPVAGPFDLTVMLDCEGPSRTGTLEGQVTASAELLVIDHHPASRSWGTVEIRDTSAAATGEILTDLFAAASIPLSPEIADCLMTALVLDTGGFRYSNTSPRTLRAAAHLVERQARLPLIYRELFENRTLAAARLLGIALGTLQTVPSGDVMYAYLTRADFERAGASENETDGINNQLIGIRGAEASALFREAPGGGVRVSLRSRNWLDCNAVARQFGGGGHVRASGCTIDRPLPEAMRLLLAQIEKHRP